MVYNWSKFAQHFAGSDCVLCGATSRFSIGLCKACQANLPIIHHPCPRCAIPMAINSGILCGRCQTHPPHFSRAFAPYYYAPPLPGFITALKFHDRLAHARLLGKLLLNALLASPPSRPDCLIPVPLHPTRLRHRGFNQALEIARPVANNLGLPIITGQVERHRDTRPQSDLGGIARRHNLHRAFRVEEGFPYGHVAIIDDVITTGNTVNELARALIQANVDTVQVWAVARA